MSHFISRTTTATRLNVKFILLQQISVLGVPTIVVLSQGEPTIVEGFKPFSLTSVGVGVEVGVRVGVGVGI